jgi:tRNA-modifying protein YgfZ
MFQENQIVSNYDEFINDKFTNAVKNENDIKIFSSFENELDALKNGVGIRITPEPTIIRLVGKESLEFLHRVSTNSVKDLTPFNKKRTLFLNEKGRIIARTTLLSFDGEYWLLSDSDLSGKLFSWVNKYIIAEDIKTENYTGKYSLVELVGPQASTFLMLLIGDEQNQFGVDQFRRFDVDGFTFYLFQDTENHSTKYFKIIIDKNRLIDLITHLDAIKSVFDLSCIGSDAYNHFRIEKGIASYPNEINGESNPHEVNLLRDVCSTKGCYIGQEVIARLETYDKVQQKLYRVILGEKVEQANHTIYNSEGNEIGLLTTVCNSNSDLKALALIKKKLITSANGYYISTNGKKISVKINETEIV